VLFLAANFLLTAVVYLLLSAPFLALIQVIVYAGAIMVLFLFVVMLMGPAEPAARATSAPQRLLAVAAAVALAAALTGAVLRGAVTSPALTRDIAAPAPDPAFGGPAMVGMELFTHYAVAVETVSLLLLVAMIGAVVLARGVGGRLGGGG
jgi:NADH-quinone oxidoreductase subunit J